jgi:UDP-N-acetylmuramoyl-tripeptide--D-alanyl-D-alanine ligase
VGRYARASGVARLLAYGPQSRAAVDSFGQGGQWFETIEELVAEARRSLRSDVVLLVKGSRSNRLERVTAALADANREAAQRQ